MKKIIFIYYNKNKCQLRSRFYRELGPDVFEAFNVDNIISIAKAETPYLIVLDLQEHKLSCQFVASELKKLKIFTHVISSENINNIAVTFTEDASCSFLNSLSKLPSSNK